MVGASRWITQAPFVLEAVVASFIGVILAGLGVFARSLPSWILRLGIALYNLSCSRQSKPRIFGWLVATGWHCRYSCLRQITASITLRAYVRK